MHLGRYDIDETLVFSVATHDPSTGAVTDADAVPSFRVYEDETTTAIATGSMAKLDDTNTTGFYSEQLTLSAANGYEAGKSYNIYISAAVGGTTGVGVRQFSMRPADARQGFNSLVDTTLATVTSQTEMTLTAGPTINNALLDAVAIFTDTNGDTSFRSITSYTGATKAITIDSGPDFTVVATDLVTIYPTARAASAAAIADATWDEARSGHTTAGTFGEGVKAESLNTQAKADVNAEVDSALNTAIPGSPTADSINERVAAIDNKLPAGTLSDFDETSDTVSANLTQVSGNTQAATNFLHALSTMIAFNVQAGTTTTSIVTDLTETDTDAFVGRDLYMTNGTADNQKSSITAYDGVGKILTVAGFTQAPAAGNIGIII